MPKRTKKTVTDPRQLGALCDECPLRECGPPVFGEGPARPLVTIICEAPGGNEVAIGRPLMGASGEALEQLLVDVGATRADCYLDNALLCMPTGGNLEDFLSAEKRKLKDQGLEDTFKDPVDCCRKRLYEAIGVPSCANCGGYAFGVEALNVERCHCPRPLWVEKPRKLSRSVVTAGNAAMRAVFGFEGIMNWRGSCVPWREELRQR